MAYGILKVDTVTFTNNSLDQSVTVSGIVDSISGNLTVTGTVSGSIGKFASITGGTIVGTAFISGLAVTGNTAGFTTVTGTTVTGTTANFVTVSGTTVTGTTGKFTSVTGVTIVGTTTISGLAITGNTAGFTTVTGTTVTGNTVNAVTVSGTTVTGNTGKFTSITGVTVIGTTTISGLAVTGNTAGFTTVTGTTVTGTTANFVTLSGTTVTGDTAGFTTVTGTTVTGTTANFVTLSGTTITGGTINVTTTNITSGIFAAGSAAAPSIAFTGDTDTGIYSPGANQVAISTNGTGRLFVDASGRVIIGASTAAIGNPLEVVGNSSSMAIGVRGRSADNIGAIGFYPNASSTESARIQSNGDSTLIFGTGSAGTERMRLDSSGLLGLGTSSPGGKLHIALTGSATTPIVNVGSFGANGVVTLGGIANNSEQVYFGTGDVGGAGIAAGIGFLREAAGWNSALAFYTNNVTSGPNGVSAIQEKMRITSGGLVGIGITGPNAQSQLHVVGSGYQPLYLNTTNAGGGGATFFRSDTQALYVGTAGSSWLTGSSTADGLIRSEANLIFGIGNSEKARIDSSGRLGIGTSSPNYRLHVVNTSAGAIATQLFLQNNSQTDGTGARIDFSAFDDGTTATGSIENVRESPALYSLRFKTYQTSANLEAMRLDSSGKLLVGTSSSVTSFQVQVEGTTESNSGLSLRRNNAGAFGPGFGFYKSRGTATGSFTTVLSGDSLGQLYFYGADGTQDVIAATITAQVDATPGANDMPGRLVFSTTADGASSPTERMRITNAGLVGLGTSSPAQALHVLQSGGNNFAGIRTQNSNSGTGIAGLEFSSDATYAKAAVGLIRSDANGVGSLVFYNASSTGAANWSTADERARIDSSGRLLVGTSTAFVEGFNNALTASQLSKGSGSIVRCISDTRTVAAVNNSTVDVWVGRTAAGNPYNQAMAGHFYVIVGGANCFTGVYSIVTTSLGTSSATLAAVSTVTRGTSPVSSVQIANDGASGAIKLTITYINNAGVVNGLDSYVSFVGLAA